MLLNLLLLPIWGLLGAVVATATSTSICLTAILLISRRQGMQLDRGTWLIVAAPLALTQGTTIAVGVVAVLYVAAWGTPLILNAREHAQLRQTIVELLSKLKLSWQQRTTSTAGA